MGQRKSPPGAAGLGVFRFGLERRHHRCRRAAPTGKSPHQRRRKLGRWLIAPPSRFAGVPSSRSCVRAVMTVDQLSFLAPADTPEGLRYAPDFLAETEQAALIRRLEELPFRPFEFHGFLGKRETISFGWSYRFDGSGLAEAAPIPDWLLPSN